MKTNTFCITLILCLLLPLGTSAQLLMKKRPAQITFVTPLSTNGVKAPRIINHLSVNVIGGINGGVEGTEVGGIFNIDKKHVEGLQIAGFVNVVGSYVTGLQIAGFANVVGGESHALQAAGFVNILGGRARGSQFAGFANLAGGKMTGLQAAGFFNAVGGNMKGSQISGFANMASNVSGFQFAGFANIAKKVNGGQVAGFINIAKRVKGVQIGVINIAKEMDGIPIGLLSFIQKGGIKQLDISTSEALKAQVALKMGVRRFYNIFAVGATVDDDGPDHYAFGYGMGTQWGVRGFISNLEIMTWNVNRGFENWFDEVSLLNQVKFTLGHTFGKHFTLYGGPVYNLMISSYDHALNLDDPGLAPEWAFTDKLVGGGRTRFQQWLGFTGGVRF